MESRGNERASKKLISYLNIMFWYYIVANEILCQSVAV